MSTYNPGHCERCGLPFSDIRSIRLIGSMTGEKATVMLYEHDTELTCIHELQTRIRNLERLIADRLLVQKEVAP